MTSLREWLAQVLGTRRGAAGVPAPDAPLTGPGPYRAAGDVSTERVPGDPFAEGASVALRRVSTSIAACEGALYFADPFAGEIGWVAGGGGEATVLARGLGRAGAFAVDSAGVCFADLARGTVSALAREREGESPMVLAANEAGLGAIALGGGYVYWLAGEGSTLRRVPRAGGAIETVAASLREARALVCGDDGAWFLAHESDGAAGVYCARYDEHLALARVRGSHPIAALALGGAYVYWLEGERLLRQARESAPEAVEAAWSVALPAVAHALVADPTAVYVVTEAPSLRRNPYDLLCIDPGDETVRSVAAFDKFHSAPGAALALDDDAVYLIAGARVLRVAR